MQGRDRPRARRGRPPSRDRRHRRPRVLGGHAARGARRLRRRHAPLGGDVDGARVTGNVHAEGDLDFRGTLGVDREAPVGFAAIRLRFDLASDESKEALDKLLELTERYCVVFQTLAGGVPVELSYATSTS